MSDYKKKYYKHLKKFQINKKNNDIYKYIKD